MCKEVITKEYKTVFEWFEDNAKSMYIYVDNCRVVSKEVIKDEESNFFIVLYLDRPKWVASGLSHIEAGVKKIILNGKSRIKVDDLYFEDERREGGEDGDAVKPPYPQWKVYQWNRDYPDTLLYSFKLSVRDGYVPWDGEEEDLED